MAETPKNLKISSPDPNVYRTIREDILRNSAIQAMKARLLGQDPSIANLAPIISILEGTGRPYGINPNPQDISAKRTQLGQTSSPLLLSTNKQRLSLEGVDPAEAQQMILQDKKTKLLANKGTYTPEEVAQSFRNANIPNTRYADAIKKTLEDISLLSENKVIKELLDSYNENKISITPTLDLLK